MSDCPEAALLVLFGGLFGAALVEFLHWLNSRAKQKKASSKIRE